MEQCQGGDGEGEDVALDEGSGQKGPRIYKRELWDEVQIRDDNLGVCSPLLVADSGAQDALQAQRDEQDARNGRNVYSGRHLGQNEEGGDWEIGRQMEDQGRQGRWVIR